ncbi:uncharacterized protein LOC124156208 isoform X2 [Ischnura elegans]|uniref:uncharacterized protein LOC124156208 isoform X1 n=1 Tax=Ischnura elegans TaxID=197161 RepID=UPI001ED887F9|nr:uncharacterized protein LOC124156208 isoform X1 [Ischnura elegans]XP_046386554.1 uncharacterized protein LOC124156208 isoform X2 [Ischnura elegans]
MAAKYVVLALAAICIAQASAASIVRRSAEGGNTLEQMMANARTLHPEASALVRCRHVDAPSVDEVVLVENMTKEVEEGTNSVSDENMTQMETQGSELSERGNAALQEDTVQLNESLNGMKRSKREFLPCHDYGSIKRCPINRQANFQPTA